MSLADIEMIFTIILLALKIVILVKDNFLKPKKHKKNRRYSGKNERRFG